MKKNYIPIPSLPRTDNAQLFSPRLLVNSLGETDIITVTILSMIYLVHMKYEKIYKVEDWEYQRILKLDSLNIDDVSDNKFKWITYLARSVLCWVIIEFPSVFKT